jgi:hypothetical protein
MKPHTNSLLAILGMAFSSGAMASDVDCYDAKIRARPTAQIPTVYPDDPEYIVISWPWFLDLKVKTVLEGKVLPTKITVLAVLHNPYRDKTRLWLLRRNTAGSFNVIRNEASSVPRCKAGTDAAQPYLRPGEGKTFEDYRREGEEALRRYDNEK